MSFDNSRFTFDPRKNFSGVVMEQGRVQLDSDWNEWLAEISRRIQAGTLDTLGHAVYPATTPAAFQITAQSGTPNTIMIGCGRMYVDGLLAENHGLRENATWDPALAELSGAPQPPPNPAPPPSPGNTADYTHQPYYPGATVPTGAGPYLFYLDVWTRPVTWLEDPHLIDPAVGVDTTGRLQTVWQVKYLPYPSGATTYTCATADSAIAYPPASAGLLSTNVVPNPTAGPCCLTAGTGYTGVENQFYRVEIHQAGEGSDAASLSGATFKWSRDNASVTTGVTAINPGTDTANNTVSVLSVMSLGRDQVLGFSNGDWIEILDDWTEFWGMAGVLCQIDSVDPSSKTITLTSQLPTTATTPGDFPIDTSGNTYPHRHTRIVRWDQSGTVYDVNGNKWCDLGTTGGQIPVPAPDTTLVLENGITVTFSTSASGSNFNIGDFWTFDARTANGKVETLVDAPPRGIHHHYTKLCVVTFGSPASFTDCRTEWPPSAEGGACGCCTYTVGDNVSTFGQYSTIQDAISALPTTGPLVGGEVCLLPGRYFQYVTINSLNNVVIRGCGAQTRLASPSMQSGGSAATTNTVAQSGLPAIITIVGSQNIELKSFAIEAASEAGILIDSASTPSFTTDAIRRSGATARKAATGAAKAKAAAEKPVDVGVTSAGFNINYNYGIDNNFTGVFLPATPYYANTDVTLEDLVITGSTSPAIVSTSVYLLKVSNNRIAMQDTASLWSSVYLCGSEIHFDHNWVGLQDAPNAISWVPPGVVADLDATGLPGFGAGTWTSPSANGGIQIAGYSQDVFVADNEIEGGAFNGITLGSFIPSGGGGSAPTGLFATAPSGFSSAATLALPSGATSDGTMLNVQIAGNRIRNVGLCGIGPVGFFDMQDSPEIVSVQNLTITGNTIASTLQDTIASTLNTGEPVAQSTVGLGYGAICVSDAQNLILRDNTITDFGNPPGAQVCGIYIFNGEQVEISRNQVMETRDWSAPAQGALGAQAGIAVMAVTPPALDPATALAWSSGATGTTTDNPFAAPQYQPGVPALRVEQNVVRLPLGLALEAFGYGPFSIVNNHLSTGGTLTVSDQTELQTTFAGNQQTAPPALTVAIMNLGLAIELDARYRSYTAVYNAAPSAFGVAFNPLASSTSGAVLFTNNICQLETRASGAAGYASVGIFTMDHLIFANNHCWVDGQSSPMSALTDIFLLAMSLHACGNRLQEAYGSVLVSGYAIAVANITALNFSTYCLFASPSSGALAANGANVVGDPTYCQSDTEG